MLQLFPDLCFVVPDACKQMTKRGLRIFAHNKFSLQLGQEFLQFRVLFFIYPSARSIIGILRIE